MRLNALTFTNSLVMAAPRDIQRRKIIFELDVLGANEALLGSFDLPDEHFQLQLNVYAGFVQQVPCRLRADESSPQCSPVARSIERRAQQ